MSNTVGSNYYFSPEICRGDNHSGKPSDIWALGVTLFLLLFKDYPFKAKSQDYKALYHNIKHSVPEFPHDFADFQAIDLLEKMLIKNPKKRISIKEIMNHDWVTF